jgi:putative transcriptional regulator
MRKKNTMQIIANGKVRTPRIDRTRFNAAGAFASDEDVPLLTMRELKEMKVVAPRPRVDVAALRKRLGMSQPVFARMFGLSVGTVRDWEQGRCQPDGPARVLLCIIEREPKAVERALAA